MPLPSLPTVGADVDSWGTELNAFLEALAERLPVVPGWTSGQWYNYKSHRLTGHGSTQALTANSIYGCPLWVPGDQPIDRVGIAVQTGAGSITRLMAHESLDNALPGDLIFDFGTVATNTSGDKEIAGSWTLPGGLIWLTAVPDAAITAYKYDGGNDQSLGASSQAGERGSPFRANGGTTAPDPFGTSGISYLSVGFIRLAVRAA